MIQLTRLNGSEVVVNALLVQQIEAMPDTIVTLTTGAKFIVRETPDEVIDKAVHYLQHLHTSDADAGEVAVGQWGRIVR